MFLPLPLPPDTRAGSLAAVLRARPSLRAFVGARTISADQRETGMVKVSERVQDGQVICSCRPPTSVSCEQARLRKAKFSETSCITAQAVQAQNITRSHRNNTAFLFFITTCHQITNRRTITQDFRAVDMNYFQGYITNKMSKKWIQKYTSPR